MALTKAVAEVDAWAEIAQNAIREGAEADVSGAYETMLSIDCALSSTTAHTGTEIIVLVNTHATQNDTWEKWGASFVACIGTAIKVDLGGDEAAGQTILTVTNPVTNNLDIDGKFLFLEHTATPANSEIVYQIANSADAGDTITILDGLQNAQTAADSDFYTIDTATGSAVTQFNVLLPATVSRAKVLYNNKYDADGSTVYTRTRLTKITAV